MAKAIHKGVEWLFNTEIGINFLMLAITFAWGVLALLAATGYVR